MSLKEPAGCWKSQCRPHFAHGPDFGHACDMGCPHKLHSPCFLLFNCEERARITRTSLTGLLCRIRIWGEGGGMKNLYDTPASPLRPPKCSLRPFLCVFAERSTPRRPPVSSLQGSWGCSFSPGCDQCFQKTSM